ncbi:MAG: hypothetical protein AAFP97_02040 [Pseudomonadota bacterium]
MTLNFTKVAVLAAFLLPVVGCSPAASDDVEGGGLEPPPGFLTQADVDCRAAAVAASILGLGEAVPDTRQLNGQTLLQYELSEGGTAQCVVRHADGSVADIRVLRAD